VSIEKFEIKVIDVSRHEGYAIVRAEVNGLSLIVALDRLLTREQFADRLVGEYRRSITGANVTDQLKCYEGTGWSVERESIDR